MVKVCKTNVQNKRWAMPRVSPRGLKVLHNAPCDPHIWTLRKQAFVWGNAPLETGMRSSILRSDWLTLQWLTLRFDFSEEQDREVQLKLGQKHITLKGTHLPFITVQLKASVIFAKSHWVNQQVCNYSARPLFISLVYIILFLYHFPPPFLF